MRYSLDQVEAFVLAARNSSISKAARILGKAQSTISLAIANLEIDLGVQLFDRSGKFPVLTEEGKTLLSEAESVLYHCRVFDERSLHLMREVEETLRLCIDETLPPDLTGNALAALHAEFPHVRVQTVPPEQEGVAERIQSGRADIGFTVVQYRYPEDIGFSRLGQIRLVNVAVKTHPLCDVDLLRFSHLNDTRQIAYSPSVGRIPTNQHLDTSNSWGFTTYSVIIEAVRQGLGWATLPYHLAEPYLKSGEFVHLILEAYQRSPWRVNTDIVWSTRRKPGAVAWWLREFLAKKGKLSEYID